MTRSGTGRFAIWAGVTTLGSGLAVLALTAPRGAVAVRWGLAAWLVLSAIGVAGGIWLSAKHGTPGSGFLAALGYEAKPDNINHLFRPRALSAATEGPRTL